MSFFHWPLRRGESLHRRSAPTSRALPGGLEGAQHALADKHARYLEVGVYLNHHLKLIDHFTLHAQHHCIVLIDTIDAAFQKFDQYLVGHG